MIDADHLGGVQPFDPRRPPRRPGTSVPVVVERRGHVMVITLNRPAVDNVVNLEMARRVGEALEGADADPEALGL